MSNRPPKINPTGTKFENVLVRPWRDSSDGRLHQEPSKAWHRMMKVVEEYIKADYLVDYREEVVSRHDVMETRATVTCSPPLFPFS